MARKRKGPGRPRTTGGGTAVAVRLQDELLRELDRWRKKQGGALAQSRSAAIQQLIASGLAAAQQGEPADDCGC